MGQAVTITDAEGKDTHYTYDYAGNIKKILYPDGKKLQVEYDALHQLIQLEDWLGVTKIERNLEGRPICVTDYRGNTMQYEWDCYGKRTKTKYPDGREIFYEYETNQKLTRIQWEKEFVEYKYNEKGYLEEKNYSNGKTSTYGYDKNGKLQFLLHRQERELLRYQYEYDVEGLPIFIREDTPKGSSSYRYEYDALNRITKVEKDLCCLRKYEYDGFGNRIKKKERNEETYYQYNENNQLVREETGAYVRTYDYDKRGNIHTQYENGALSETYFYNGRNLLERVKKDNGIELSYEYDGFGHQVRKEVLRRELEKQSVEEVLLPQRKTIEYLLDLTRSHHNIIKERKEQKETSYIWEPESYELVGLAEEEESYFYQNDRLGSPVRLLDEEGKTVASYEYEEFGKRIDQRILQKEQPFGFIGYEKEEESGLYHTEKRWYNPVIGVFYGIDTIKGNTAEPFTIHAYLFCLNNPLHFIDVDGAMTQEEKDRAKDEGTEADNFLKQFFLWYFTGRSGYTAEAQVKIPGSSLNPKYKNGYCDLLLTHNNRKIVEIYELKKSTNDCARWHSKDVKQLDSYIQYYRKQPDKEIKRGTTFNPTGLLIQSELNPQYYIKYYTHYNQTHKLMDPDKNQVIIDSKTGKPIIENFQGFIYWKYVKIEGNNPRPYTVWVRNKNGKGGEFQTNIENRRREQAQQELEDDIAAATGWIVVGGLAWFGVKAVLSGFGQWWVWACP